jgi:hypothetical protein
MNEAIRTHPRKALRRKLLLTVSSVVLLLAAEARAEDADHPILWIEFGGAFDQISNGEDGWLPHNLTPPISKPSPEPFGHVPNIGYDFDGAITFAPEDSAWTYTASVRYGRGQLSRHTHDQTYQLTHNFLGKYALTTYAFLNASQIGHSAHAILDFTAGRDVGLGLFRGDEATLNFGIRVVQLNEHARATLGAFSTAPAKYSTGKIVHEADASITRGFTGAGPTVAWDDSAPLLGSMHDGLSFDWGANVAILFGRQKARLALHTKNTRYYGYGANAVLSHATYTPVRDKTVAVPNAGGFAGLSWRLPNGKISFGYRADFFFGAIDGGLTSAKSETRGFYGPFANVSIGIGG